MEDKTDTYPARNMSVLSTFLDNMRVSMETNSAFLNEQTLLFEYVQIIWTSIITDIMDTYNEEAEILHKSSLVMARLYELSSSVDWHRVSLFSSAYEPALRDLRYYLEDMIAAYLLDYEHCNETNEAKMMYYEKLPCMQIQVKRCHFPADFGDEIYALYRRLCGFSHPSSHLLRDSQQPWSARLGEDHERFLQALALFKETYDYVTTIVLYRFSKLMDSSILQPQMLDLDFLQEVQFKTTLSKLI